MTGFICAAYVLQIPKGYNQELLVLGLLYGFISLYLFSCHVSTYRVTQIYSRIIQKIFVYLDNHSSDRVRTLCYGITVICIIIATVLSFPEKQESPRVKRLIPLLGMTLFVVCSYLASVHRKAVPWNTIFTALLLQFLLALFVFRTSVGHDVFNWVAVFVEGYMHNASYGAEFLFGTAAVNANTFALNLFPVIIFFASTVQMLYYVGALQWILKKLSLIFMSIMEVSGAEAIVAAATPFIGACENALLIEPFVPDLTLSEIHQVMTCGFATVSGSTLYGYTSMGVSGQALLTSCIMSIPCSIAISKLRYPETKIPVTKEKTEINVHTDDDISNIVHAATKGASMGIQIVLMIGACVISILATLYAVNAFLTWLGRFVNIQELTLQLITGYLFVPIAWLIGADNQDLVIVGRLMATKIWSNEFIAFKQMTDTYKGQITPRSELVTTYALCGFANFGSVGMQIGVLSAIAPKRSDIISQLALSALICGSLSTWLSAAIAGMLI
ncbi:Na+ dependent nucleoside transporter C-terminus-domain-containing protein [Gilbertella persicaria]|uniref:Na+ dependent nucleoside transporter C-terminus-domain-containing protein n=1 Tax=Gilbertella persicaria TaxID=101096 RepID=UPI00221F41EB|nr:Na+ dependent nucleoside transporter C-terminus-domain-containing protein [Gilbertella persicaria]KAI8080220.1 Na+ dependent nucleoside transporter C-terminus-domain-containing protein [Gilbertella persicaria]